MREVSALAGYIKCSQRDIHFIVTNIFTDIIRKHELYHSSNWQSSVQNMHRQPGNRQPRLNLVLSAKSVGNF